MTDKLRTAAQQAERAAFEAWVAKVQPTYWRVEAWQTEAWSMWQSISAALAEHQEPLTFETAAEARADREHAEAYYRQAEHLLTANERTLHAEIARLEAQLAEQPAEQEPVAVVAPWPDYVDWLRDEPPVGTKLYTAPQPAKPAEQEPKTQGWQPIETAPKGRVLLVYYKNSLGNGRTMRARHYLPETLESDTTESGWADEGWYEESEAYEYLMPLEHDPTHWMPLPAGPDTAPQPAKRVQLTDEEVLKIWSPEPSRPVMGKNKVLTFARAIERAHGIGEQE